MRRPLLISTLLITCYPFMACAQAPPKGSPKPPAVQSGITLADVAGAWAGKSMIGPRDSVVATYVLTATAHRTGWTMTLPSRAPVPTRVLVVGGDSIVTEAGPYESVLRKGQQVTTKTTGHYKGDKLTGTFEARYASGDVLKGKIEGSRKK